MIRIEDLRIEVPGFRLGPLDLRIDAGEYFVLLGPNGSGKTSVLEWAAGFRAARSGRLFVGDADVTDARPADRGLAVVFQQSALFPHLSVRHNIAFPLQRARWASGRIAARVDELANLLHVASRLDAAPDRVSGGEARRIALARALALPRRVLLLDEPLAAVDPARHRELRSELARLHRELGLTVVHVTHSIVEARTLGSRLGVMVEGRLVQVGPTADVFDRPENRLVARALAVSNFVEGIAGAEGPLLDVGPGLPAVAVTGRGHRARLFELAFAAAPSERTRPGEVVARQVDANGLESLWVRLHGTDIELEVQPGSNGNFKESAHVHVDFSRARAERY